MKVWVDPLVSIGEGFDLNNEEILWIKIPKLD